MRAADLKMLATLAVVGSGELLQRLVAGQLDRRFAWAAVRGSEACRRAIVSGDVCDEADGRERLAVGCLRCPRRVQRRGRLGYVVFWCGEPGVEDLDGGTCGCFVALGHPDGTTTPECATRVASKVCPSGYWGTAPRVSLTVSA